MKRIVTILPFACFAFIANTHAQTALTPATATVTDAGTQNLAIKIPGSWTDLTFQLNVTKVTGTPAGTAFLQGSLDGVNYATVPGTDTLTLTNVASITKVWALNRSRFLFYNVKVVGTGTQSTTVGALYLSR